MKARPLIVGVTFLWAGACNWGLDPDRGRFSCASEPDCGEGYECIAQLAGGGLCFPLGVCNVEICNGEDDDCDGGADDDFDFQNDPIHCGACEQACPTGTTCITGTCLPS